MPFHVIDGNNQFRIAFEAHGSLRSVLFDLNSFPPFEPILWVWDGHDAKERRRKLYPNYKVGRQSGSDEFYKTMDLFKQVLPFTRCMSLEIPGWEADDVIATLHKIYAPTTDRFNIRSNDGDFLALCDGKHTHIVGRENVTYEATDQTEVRLMKALVGDPSDKITGIPYFGAGAWEKTNRTRWREFFEEDAKIDWAAEAQELALASRPLNWLMTPGNEKALRGMYQIIGFFEVDPALIASNLVVGKPNDVELNAILKDFLI